MLWTVFHLWLLELVFFNYYHHHSLLVLRNGYGTENILHSKEGVAQGAPLAMVYYSVGFLLLIKRMKLAYPDVT